MDIENPAGLEKSLAKTESDAEAAVKTAIAAVGSLKKFRTAAQTGNLRELRKAIEAAEQAITAMQQQFTNAKDGWVLDEDAYLSGKSYTSEVLEAAEQAGMKIFEQDDRLFCYPFLIRILSGERTVLIDKVKERRMRPSVLVKHLKDLQGKPPKFKPEAFLESLYSAFEAIVTTGRKDSTNPVNVVKLKDIYRLLTLLPGQSKEYSLHEFARDIYLLDQSRIARTRKGLTVSFPASTGTKSNPAAISVVTQHGDVKKYYGILFSEE